MDVTYSIPTRDPYHPGAPSLPAHAPRSQRLREPSQPSAGSSFPRAEFEQAWRCARMGTLTQSLPGATSNFSPPPQFQLRCHPSKSSPARPASLGRPEDPNAPADRPCYSHPCLLYRLPPDLALEVFHLVALWESRCLSAPLASASWMLPLSYHHLASQGSPNLRTPRKRNDLSRETRWLSRSGWLDHPRRRGPGKPPCACTCRSTCSHPRTTSSRPGKKGCHPHDGHGQESWPSLSNEPIPRTSRVYSTRYEPAESCVA